MATFYLAQGKNIFFHWACTRATFYYIDTRRTVYYFPFSNVSYFILTSFSICLTSSIHPYIHWYTLFYLSSAYGHSSRHWCMWISSTVLCFAWRSINWYLVDVHVAYLCAIYLNYFLCAIYSNWFPFCALLSLGNLLNDFSYLICTIVIYLNTLILFICPSLRSVFKLLQSRPSQFHDFNWFTFCAQRSAHKMRTVSFLSVCKPGSYLRSVFA
jgi:hypothetical protein